MIDMTIEITVPRLGWSMEEGAFCRWLKQDGDTVREGDELFELEGDKATQVVESFDAGVLRIPSDGPQPGDVVKVGQVLGHLEPRAKTAAARLAKPKPASASAREIDAQEQGTAEPRTPAILPVASPTALPSETINVAPTTAQRLRGRSGQVPVVASPSVRRLARELGVDLHRQLGGAYPLSAADVLRSLDSDKSVHGASTTTAPETGTKRSISPRARRIAHEIGVDVSTVRGSGRGGRIREADIRQAAQAAEVVAPVARQSASETAHGQPISPLRRVIAKRMMVASHDTAPVTLTAEADASEIVRFREECKRTSAERGIKAPSYTEIFVKLSAAALEKHPTLLDQWIDDRVVRGEGIHIAVAVASEHGLVTPVIHDVPMLSLRELGSKFSDLVELARTQRLAAEQMRGGAFTVSSLGGYRVDAFTPILNPPQTAILGVGRISQQPVVKQRHIAVADVVTLSLTFDHRVVDGAPAAAFLTSLCEMIESPLGWLLV